MHVAYINREYRPTGSIEGIFDLVKNNLSDKVEVSNYYFNPAHSRLWNIGQVKKFAGDINHITGDINFLALGLKKRKNILTIHDFGHFEKMRKNVVRHFILKTLWFKEPLRYVDIVTVVSEFTKNKLLTYFNFPEDRIRVIYNPVKPIFQYSPKEESSKKVRILQVGTGSHKNLYNLIIAARSESWHIDIVGKPTVQELAMLKEHNISHKLYGNITDEEMYQRYEECDVLFFASHHEGFGMPVIEAQAVGRPVITSNLGAMKEVAAGTALLVNPTEPGAIKQAIKTLSDNEIYKKYVAEGLKNIQKYNHKTISDNYMNVYLELYNRR